MTTFDSTMTQLRTITRQTQRDGVPIDKRHRGLEQQLRKLRTNERKTEPYRQMWIDRIAAYEAHIAELANA